MRNRKTFYNIIATKSDYTQQFFEVYNVVTARKVITRLLLDECYIICDRVVITEKMYESKRVFRNSSKFPNNDIKIDVLLFNAGIAQR